jgi:hypothetical protein
MIFLLMAGYLACSALTYTGLFAMFQRMFPTIAEEGYRGDMAVSLIIALTGPIGLLATIACSGFFSYGLKWR